MASESRRQPLLAPGNEEEWARINKEKLEEEAAFAASLSLPQRLEFGQKLCDRAFGIFNALRDSGSIPPGSRSTGLRAWEDEIPGLDT